MIDEQSFFNFVAGVVMSVFGFIAKHIHGKIEKTSEDLFEFKTHVAQNHPTLTSVDARFDKLDSKLDKITDKIEKLPGIDAAAITSHIKDHLENLIELKTKADK